MKKTVLAQNVETRIYRIRGQQIMLDTDLAELYGVETRILNRSVMRNRDRFPVDFMFEVSRQEIMRISQFGISSGRTASLKFSKRVLAFTEQGVAMLSGVLRSRRAVQVNIAIMRAFVRLRHAVLTSRDVSRRVEKLEGKVAMHETDIRLLIKDVDHLKQIPLPSEERSRKVKGFITE
jgi:hypothetical protein